MATWRRALGFTCLLAVTWIALGSLYSYLSPGGLRKADEDKEDARWIATSKWWLDRQSCKYAGLCGLAHWHPDPASKPTRMSRRRRKGTEPDFDIGDGETMKVEAKSRKMLTDQDAPSWQDFTEGGRRMTPEDWYGDARVLRQTPQYVLDHAPLVHLYSKEEFWPADAAEHLRHMMAHVNYTSLDKRPDLSDLHLLNHGVRGMDLYLKSLDDVEDRPAWLHSAYGRPEPYDDEEKVDALGKEDWEDVAAQDAIEEVIPAPIKPELRRRRKRMTRNFEPSTSKSPGGYSRAPATLIMIDKGHGIIDAFWFFFYSYNLGPSVFDIRFGNHVGDWEHCLMRFHHGTPKAVFFSAHQGGTSFTYEALEKGKGPGREGRPVIYSAVGSHAMYAMPGKHPYVLPWGILADRTDRGPMWDPTLNHHAFFYNTSITHDVDTYTSSSHLNDDYDDDLSAHDLPTTNTLTTNLSPETHKQRFQPSASNPGAATNWFWYNGHWGDKFYTLGDWRQWRFARQYHYCNGPIGPRFKNLGRSTVCGRPGECKMLSSIAEGKRATWLGSSGVSSLVWGERRGDVLDDGQVVE